MKQTELDRQYNLSTIRYRHVVGQFCDRTQFCTACFLLGELERVQAERDALRDRLEQATIPLSCDCGLFGPSYVCPFHRQNRFVGAT